MKAVKLIESNKYADNFSKIHFHIHEALSTYQWERIFFRKLGRTEAINFCANE